MPAMGTTAFNERSSLSTWTDETADYVLRRLDTLENNVAVNTLRDVVDEAFVGPMNMIDGIADEYGDETGVDLALTDMQYDATGNFYTTASARTLHDILLHWEDPYQLVNSGTADITLTPSGTAGSKNTYAKFGSRSGYTASSSNWMIMTTNHATSNALDIGLNADFTIDFWFRPQGTGYVFATMDPNDGNPPGTDKGMYLHYTAANDALEFAFNYDGTWDLKLKRIGAGLSSSEFRHVAIMRDAGSVSIYINGVAITGWDTEIRNAQHQSIPMDYDMIFGAGWDSGSGAQITQYFDEFSYRLDTAAWDGDFTPPTSAYGTLKDKVLTSEFNTADDIPKYGRCVFLFDPVDVVSLNNDLICSVSRDNGVTWEVATLEDRGVFSGDVRILTTDDIDVYNVGSGSTVRYKLESFNDKELEIHGAWLQWR